MSRAGAKIGYISLYSCHPSLAGPQVASVLGRGLACDGGDMAAVAGSCGDRLMFMWSRAMGPVGR